MSKRAFLTVFLLAACGDDVACEDKDVVACEADKKCMPIQGARIDTQRRCIEDGVLLACSAARSCGDSLYYAKDPQGQVWHFASTCIPADFTDRSGTPPDGIFALCNP